MDLFCHIAEFGNPGWQSVPQMAFLADRLVLWTPSAVDINRARAEGVTNLKPMDMVDLVKVGHVRVMAREAWITQPEFRRESQAGNDYSEWHDDYDGAMKEIAISTDSGVTYTKVATLSTDSDQPTIVSGPGSTAGSSTVWVLYTNSVSSQVAQGMSTTALGTYGSFGSVITIPNHSCPVVSQTASTLYENSLCPFGSPFL